MENADKNYNERVEPGILVIVILYYSNINSV